MVELYSARESGLGVPDFHAWLCRCTAETMDTVDEKPTITAVRFTTRARVPNIDAARFATIVADAKVNCVVSRALSPAIVVTLDAALAT